MKQFNVDQEVWVYNMKRPSPKMVDGWFLGYYTHGRVLIQNKYLNGISIVDIRFVFHSKEECKEARPKLQENLCKQRCENQIHKRKQEIEELKKCLK